MHLEKDSVVIRIKIETLRQMIALAYKAGAFSHLSLRAGKNPKYKNADGYAETIITKFLEKINSS